MPTTAEVLARTLRDAGVTRMFGLPGGEILHFVEAARQVGIEFILTRHEATASLMADVTGQIERRPGISVATLGPGAVNMTLGVANAYLDRSPLIAITASLARSAVPFATHQALDLNAVYRPFTKLALTLDGHNTAVKVRRAYRTTLEPRMGPVHIALPSDVARLEDEATEDPESVSLDVPPAPRAPEERIQAAAGEIQNARRPVVILGLDLDPEAHRTSVRAFVEKLGVPVFVTPKAKGILPEDHPLFFGVCAGVAADAVIVDFFGKADLLVGLGFEPVESDKLWHQTMKVLSLSPLSIAAGEYKPHCEVVGDLNATLAALATAGPGPFDWRPEELSAYRDQLVTTLRPSEPPRRGVSPYELTLRLRQLFPRETILATDVGSIKSITSQAWRSFEPLTFFESNGLSAMSYSFAAAMAARLAFPDRPVLCTVGDGGFGMIFADLETCVRRRLHFVTVVYNDSALSLIQVSQEAKGYPSYGVEYGEVNFAAAAEALGAWSRRVSSLTELDEAVREGMRVDRPVVIDVRVDPAEYRAHSASLPARRG